MRYTFSLPLTSPPVKPFFNILDLDDMRFVEPCTVADEDEREYKRLAVNEAGQLVLSSDGEPLVTRVANHRLVVLDSRRGLQSRLRRVWKASRAFLGMELQDRGRETYISQWSKICHGDHIHQGEYTNRQPSGDNWTKVESFSRLDKKTLCPDGKTYFLWYSGYDRWERDRPL